MVNSVWYVFYQPLHTLHNDNDVTVPWKLKHLCQNAYNKCDTGVSHPMHNFCSDYTGHMDR
jgi:hypothetical protein